MQFELNVLFLIAGFQIFVARKTNIRNSVENKIYFKKHRKTKKCRYPRQDTDKVSFKSNQVFIWKIAGYRLKFESIELI